MAKMCAFDFGIIGNSAEDFRFDDCVYSIVTQFKKQIVSLILFVEIIIAIVMSHRYLII